MKTGKYSVLQILEFENLEQFIIPEIQRDYVWTTNDVADLLESIKDGFSKNSDDIPYLGFIYAYNDRDYVYKYMLIDGQQRMTTIFLLLIACYQRMGKEIPEYLIKDLKLKIDYKVRQATHDFLSDFVKHCQNNPKGFDFVVKDQIWYHNDYINDQTIRNIIANYSRIRDWLCEIDLTKMNEFVHFVEEDVQISYFDIENGRQGEELYIYMNSRGLQLEANETLKARYLEPLKTREEKEFWGRKWETWQDYFWKHRYERVDADEGFNDFLSMVQVVNMCQVGKSSDEISDFIRKKSTQVPSFECLPKSLDEISGFFESYKKLVESKIVNEFYAKYEKQNDYLSISSTINPNRKQIYYLRIIPVLALINFSKITHDDSIIRFVRYFYNVSRKTPTVGKDISNQLPSAIRLMIEYGQSKNKDYDICDLINYTKNRTILIDEEEILKLNLYKKPPKGIDRSDLENIFWAAEDVEIFSGEIMFLLSKTYNEETETFDYRHFEDLWISFSLLFVDNKTDEADITRSLLYYGKTWVRDTPNYYVNYNCQDWYNLVRIDAGVHLYSLLKDMIGEKPEYIEKIIKRKIKEYFTKKDFKTIEDIKRADDLFTQVRILAALDFYNDKILWNDAPYIAEDENNGSEDYGDKDFFENDRVIFNVERYIYDGSQGRVLSDLEELLKNKKRLNSIINDIMC